MYPSSVNPSSVTIQLRFDVLTRCMFASANSSHMIFRTHFLQSTTLFDTVFSLIIMLHILATMVA